MCSRVRTTAWHCGASGIKSTQRGVLGSSRHSLPQVKGGKRNILQLIFLSWANSTRVCYSRDFLVNFHGAFGLESWKTGAYSCNCSGFRQLWMFALEQVQGEGWRANEELQPEGNMSAFTYSQLQSPFELALRSQRLWFAQLFGCSQPPEATPGTPGLCFWKIPVGV